jgi:hypothetical protein
VWRGAGEGDADAVFARRFNSSGTPLAEFRVNSVVAGSQTAANVEVSAAGAFVGGLARTGRGRQR